jgi:hypothetical protein
MKKRVGTLFLVFSGAVALSGCAIRSASGPCYGFGCPPMTGAGSDYAANGQNEKEGSSHQANLKPEDEKPHGLVAFLKNLLPSHHKGATPAAPVPPATSTASGN